MSAAGGRLRPAAGGDMLGGARAEHLAGVERRAAGARDAMGAGGLADRVAARQAAAAPGVDGDAAVHVLVVDGELQRLGGDVDLVAAVELDRERVHVPQPVDRHAPGSPRRCRDRRARRRRGGRG